MLMEILSKKTSSIIYPNKPTSMTEANKEFMILHSMDFTVPELSEKTGLTEEQVENFCHRNKLRYKYVEKYRKNRKTMTAIKTISRAPAYYSNKTPFGIAS